MSNIHKKHYLLSAIALVLLGFIINLVFWLILDELSPKYAGAAPFISMIASYLIQIPILFLISVTIVRWRANKRASLGIKIGLTVIVLFYVLFFTNLFINT